MCGIHIEVQCIDEFFEVLVGDIGNAELAVENLVSSILLELFQEVTVDGVIIDSSPHPAGEKQVCSIYIQASCPIASLLTTQDAVEKAELMLEAKVSSVLMELFGMVLVERILIQVPLRIAA